MTRANVRVIGAALSAAALMILSFFTPVVASASTGPDGWIGYNTGPYPNGHQLGTYLPNGYGQRSVCIDISTPGNYMAPPSSPTSPVTMYDPLIAWVLKNYSQSTDPSYTAALEYFVGVRINSNSTEIQNAWNELASYSPTHFAGAQAALNDITAQAASYAGPYSGDLNMTASANGWTGAVTNVGVRPAGPGNAWPYVPYTTVDLTLSGPAVFDQTGTNTISGTTDGWGGLSGVSLAWHATSPGVIAVSGTVHGLALLYTLYPSPGAGVQRMVTMASLGDLAITDPVAATALTPSVTSHLQHQLADGTWVDTDTVRVNEKVRDALKIVNGMPNTTMTLDWSAQTSAQPFSAANPSGTVIASGTVQIALDASGAGSVLLPFTIPVDYSGHVGVDTYLHGDGNFVADVDPPIFDNGESAPVVKWSPTLVSHLQKQASDGTWANANTFMAGDTVRDAIVISGGAPNSPVVLDWAENTSDAAFSATNVGTVYATGSGIAITLDQNGAATYYLPVSTAAGSGYIGIDTYLHGLAQNADVDPPVWDANESGLVTIWKPKVTTLASSAAVDSGTPMTDQIMITDARPNTAFTCSAALYGPFAGQPTEQPTVPTDAVKVGTATCQGKTGPDGTASVITTALTAPAAGGYYVWVATLDAMKVSNGDVTSAAATETFGAVSESTLVTALASNGEDSGGGIDGGIPENVTPGDLVKVSLLVAGGISLAVVGAFRLRKVHPGPRRAYTD